MVDGKYDIVLNSNGKTAQSSVKIDNTMPFISNIDFKFSQDGKSVDFIFDIQDPEVFGVKSGLDLSKTKIYKNNQEFSNGVTITGTKIFIKVEIGQSNQFLEALAKNQIKFNLTDNLVNREVIQSLVKGARVAGSMLGNASSNFSISSDLEEDEQVFTDDFHTEFISTKGKYRDLVYNGLETYSCDNNAHLSADIINVKEDDKVAFGLGIIDQNNRLLYTDLVESTDRDVSKTKLNYGVRYSVPWNKKDGVRKDINGQVPVNTKLLPTGHYYEAGIDLRVVVQKNFCTLFTNCVAPVVYSPNRNLFDPIGVYLSKYRKWIGAIVQIKNAEFDMVNVEQQVKALSILRNSVISRPDHNFKFGKEFIDSPGTKNKFGIYQSQFGIQYAITNIFTDPNAKGVREPYYLNLLRNHLGNGFVKNDYEDMAHIFEGHGQFYDVNKKSNEASKFESDLTAINSILNAHKDRCRAKNATPHVGSSYNQDTYRIINSDHTPVDTGNLVGCGKNKTSKSFNTNKIGYITQFHSEKITTVFPATQWIQYSPYWTGTLTSQCPTYTYVP